MSRREHQHPQLREIRVTFDPSRLSRACLAHAYEHVVPIVRRVPTRSSRRDQEQGEERQQLPSSGVSVSLG